MAIVFMSIKCTESYSKATLMAQLGAVVATMLSDS